jgi:hypothetical protein
VLFLQILGWNSRAGFRIEAVDGLGEEHLDASVSPVALTAWPLCRTWLP